MAKFPLLPVIFPFTPAGFQGESPFFQVAIFSITTPHHVGAIGSPGLVVAIERINLGSCWIVPRGTVNIVVVGQGEVLACHWLEPCGCVIDLVGVSPADAHTISAITAPLDDLHQHSL